MREKCLVLILLAAFALPTKSIPGNSHILETDKLPTLGDGSLNERILPSVGNGHLATNVWTDTIFINGVYNGLLGNSHRARIQNIHASDFNITGCSNPTRTYRLDTRKGVVEEELSCVGFGSVTFRTYAHAAIDRVLATEVHLIKDPLALNFQVDRIDLSGEESDEFVWQPTQQINQNVFYKTGTTLEAELENGTTIDVHVYFNSLMPSSFAISSSQPDKSFIYLMSIDVDQSKAEDDFYQALGFTFDTSGDSLRSDHLYYWDLNWQAGNIQLRGNSVDTHLQETVTSALYYLYSNLPFWSSLQVEESPFYGISPGGLANGKQGSDYYGHVFWDMETWMYPAIALFRPDLAKAMLKYRIQGMKEAQSRAAEGGFNGARFPWESARTGAEVTPDICVPCRENQQHITADIAFAARTFVALTRDLDWLAFSGNDFILEMARFWESRPTFDASTGSWDIDGVMPPDEHQQEANNSIYTNLGAVYAVNTARWTSCLLFGPSTAETLVPDAWLNKTKNLAFLYNSAKRYHEEYEGFDADLTGGTLDPRGIKQADVVLLGYPMLWDMPDDVRRNDLEIYEPITNPDGPAMTWGIFATNWIELGEEAKAAEQFNRSYAPYVRPPFNIWTEVQNGVGAVNFVTGAGGFLQAIVSGYGGVRIKPDALEFKLPGFLPPTVDEMEIDGIQYLGSVFKVIVRQSTNYTAEVTCQRGGSEPLEIVYEDFQVLPVSCSGATIGNRAESFKIQPTNPSSSCPPPSDEVNVDYA